MQQIKHFNVMVVEDEPLLLRSLARHIDALDAGFAVTCEADCGTKALELLETNDVHLIISDICMPVMSGLELLKAVQSRYPHILLVLLSGHAEFSYAQEAVRGGALDYLLKPISSSGLEQVLGSAGLLLSTRYKLEEDPTLTGNSAEQVVELTRIYLREHYTSLVDLSDFAARMGVSSAYLTKLFSKYEGCSPVKYLTNLRLSEARHLLVNTELPIREIGERVGYADQFYFSNVFRKATGYSPSVYRKDRRQE